MNLNGGYLIINKTDANLYSKLSEALSLGKPVLFYENDTTCYYIDTIALSGTDIVLTKGGKTITVEEDGDITETGTIQPSGGSNAIYIDVTDTDNYSDFNNGILTQDVFDELIDAIQNHKIIVFAQTSNGSYFELVTHIAMNENGVTNGYNLYADMYGGQFYDYQLNIDTRDLEINRP